MRNVFANILLVSLLAGCADSGKEFGAKSAETVQESLSFDQTALQKKVDILFVVDNSSSMVPDRKVLGAQFATFISSIAGSDYRIGFVNSDVNATGYQNVEGFYGNVKSVDASGKQYIDPSTPNAASVFNSAIVNQTASPCHSNGECDEQPMKAVMMALSKRDTVNASFFRDDANFVSIIITDEDELSTGGPNAVQPKDFVKFLVKQYTDGLDSFSNFVIAIPPTDAKCYDDQKKASASGNGAYPANLLWTIVNYIEGFNVSICDANFGSEMERVSEYVKSRLLFRKVLLNPPPVSKKSIEVIVKDKNGNVLDIDWKIISNNIIKFEPVPPADSEVIIKYERKRVEEDGFVQ